MVPVTELLWFASAAFLMALSPGPNMIYLLSRAICQGRDAGVISLLGVVTGFVAHRLAAAVGLSVLFLALPDAFEALKGLGAAYLLMLAWQAVRPGAHSPFAARVLPIDPPARLLLTGFLTNALNPKVAVFYLSIFPQFVSPDRGSILMQSLQLGLAQIVVSFSVNLLVVLSAATMAAWFTHHPRWLAAQRWLMGRVFAALALRLLVEPRRP